jgi:hypothetical protein
MAEREDAYEGWTILELLGRRKLGGYVQGHTAVRPGSSAMMSRAGGVFRGPAMTTTTGFL